MTTEPRRFDRAACLRVCRRLFELGLEEPGSGRDAVTAVQLQLEHQLLLQDAKKLCARLEPEHDTLAEPIRVTVRSVPVQMYANFLRHYYVRVEDVLDVHPGTRTRVALAWWHNTTVLDTDTQERELRLCGPCCDRFLDYVWRNSERFHIVWNNCDQTLNRCRQSFAVGLLLLQLFWYPLCRDMFGLALLVAVAVVFFGLRVYLNTRRAREARCDRVYCCDHVFETAGPPSATTGS